MDLYILRHGEAIKKIRIGMTDYSRPLTVAGKKDIQNVSKFLKNKKIKFHHIFCSPLTRSIQTTNIVTHFLNFVNKIKFVELEDLMPEGNIVNVCQTLSKLNPNSNVLIIGHNPLLVKMISSIISNSKFPIETNIRLKTSGLAKIRINSFSPKISGELRWLLTPNTMNS